MKNLTKQFIINRFNQDNEKAIREYQVIVNPTKYVECTYTKGAKVIVDVAEQKAYTRSGFLYMVMLQDDAYLDRMEQDYGNEIIEYADSLFAEEEKEDEE